LIHDEIRFITQKIWVDTYTQREYEVVEHDKSATIYELVDSKKIKIYPE